MTSKTPIFTIFTRLLRNVTKKIRNFLNFLFSDYIFDTYAAQTMITIDLFVIYD